MKKAVVPQRIAAQWGSEVFNAISAARRQAVCAALGVAADPAHGGPDNEALLALILRRPAPEQARLLALAYEGDYWRPACAVCGVPMVERAQADGMTIWVCVNTPACSAAVAP